MKIRMCCRGAEGGQDCFGGTGSAAVEGGQECFYEDRAVHGVLPGLLCCLPEKGIPVKDRILCLGYRWKEAVVEVDAERVAGEVLFRSTQQGKE